MKRPSRLHNSKSLVTHFSSLGSLFNHEESLAEQEAILRSTDEKGIRGVRDRASNNKAPLLGTRARREFLLAIPFLSIRDGRKMTLNMY